MSNGIIEENVEGEVDGDMSTCKYKVHKETDKEWEKGKGRQTPGKRNSPNRWQGQREAGENAIGFSESGEIFIIQGKQWQKNTIGDGGSTAL